MSRVFGPVFRRAQISAQPSRNAPLQRGALRDDPSNGCVPLRLRMHVCRCSSCSRAQAEEGFFLRCIDGEFLKFVRVIYLRYFKYVNCLDL